MPAIKEALKNTQAAEETKNKKRRNVEFGISELEVPFIDKSLEFSNKPIQFGRKSNNVMLLKLRSY